MSNLLNIHLGIYENYQSFRPLLFYGYAHLHGGWGQISAPPGSNRVQMKPTFPGGFSIIGGFLGDHVTPFNT